MVERQSFNHSYSKNLLKTTKLCWNALSRMEPKIAWKCKQKSRRTGGILWNRAKQVINSKLICRWVRRDTWAMLITLNNVTKEWCIHNGSRMPSVILYCNKQCCVLSMAPQKSYQKSYLKTIMEKEGKYRLCKQMPTIRLRHTWELSAILRTIQNIGSDENMHLFSEN